MALKASARVRVPPKAKPGEIVEIKTLISHEMESGVRKDASGKVVPRDIINKFVAAFNGKQVFEADWFPSVSANPYQSFFFKANESGEFVFTWRNDAGEEVTSKAKLNVA